MELDGFMWRKNHRGVPVYLLMIIALFSVQSLIALSLNHEGVALLRFKDRIKKDPFGALLTWKESSLEDDHCSWYGVHCVDGLVVSLELKDLCLAGTLPPELGHLVHIKLIMLRNNSLSGAVPEELAVLTRLEVLDLGFNNLSGLLPHEWGHNVAVLLLDNNGRFCDVTPEVEQLMMISEVQVEESSLSPVIEDSLYSITLRSSCAAEHEEVLSQSYMWYDHQSTDHIHRRILKHFKEDPTSPTVDTPDGPSPAREPQPPHPPTPTSESTLPPPSQSTPPPPSHSTPPPPSHSTPPPSSSMPPNLIIGISVSVGGCILIFLILGLYMWKHNKRPAVEPLSYGMTQRAPSADANGDDKVQILSKEIADTGLTQGIKNMQRSELVAACEDLSNVIGLSAIGKLYKGTLSTGSEIAVLSYAVKHTKDWSNDMQMLFTKKVDMLTRVSHKNFLNLIGFCEEENPFTRMLVFEYAPSGTLFEHLHVRESEHLDWKMRLRIVMGITYCLEYMHAQNPCITHEDLTAYAVNLTEDYAAKLSAFGIWNEVALAATPLHVPIDATYSAETSPEDNVYSFGLVLLETMTGKTPRPMVTAPIEKWASDFLKGEKTLKDFVDPMLRHVDMEQLERIGEVIKCCTVTDPNERPRMEEVASNLREVTGVAEDRAAPRFSPWWPDS